MIDEDWIESLQNGGAETKLVYSREKLIADFVSYYKDFEADDLDDEW